MGMRDEKISSPRGLVDGGMPDSACRLLVPILPAGPVPADPDRELDREPGRELAPSPIGADEATDGEPSRALACPLAFALDGEDSLILSLAAAAAAAAAGVGEANGRKKRDKMPRCGAVRKLRCILRLRSARLACWLYLEDGWV